MEPKIDITDDNFIHPWKWEDGMLCPFAVKGVEPWPVACGETGVIIARAEALATTPGKEAEVWRCRRGHEFPVLPRKVEQSNA